MRYAKSENKTLIGTWSVIIVVILLAYLLEVVKGERTITYYLWMVALGLIPLAVCYILYFKQKESPAIKYISIISYSVFYVFVLLSFISCFYV